MSMMSSLVIRNKWKFI